MGLVLARGSQKGLEKSAVDAQEIRRPCVVSSRRVLMRSREQPVCSYYRDSPAEIVKKGGIGMGDRPGKGTAEGRVQVLQSNGAVSEVIGVNAADCEVIGMDASNNERIGMNTARGQMVGVNAAGGQRELRDTPGRQNVGVHAARRQSHGCDTSGSENV